jgi:magnesium-transporting ATPase (P-type)
MRLFIRGGLIMLNEDKLFRILSMVFAVSITAILFTNIRKFVVVDNIKLFTPDSPLIFAFLVGVVLIICIAITMVGEIAKIKANTQSQEAGIWNKYRELIKVFLFIVLILSYAYFLRILHFRAATTIFLAISMYALNIIKEKQVNKMLKSAAAAAITVPVFYYIFSGIFKVLLP